MGTGSCLVRPIEAQTPRTQKGHVTVERQGRLGPGLETECNPPPASGLHTTCHPRPQEMVCRLWQPWGPGANPSSDNGSRTWRRSGQTLAMLASARSCRQASTGQMTWPPPGHYLATRHQPADPVPGLVGCMLHQRQHMLLCGAVRQAAGIPLWLEHAAVRQGHTRVMPALPAARAPGSGRGLRARFTPFLLLLNLRRLWCADTSQAGPSGLSPSFQWLYRQQESRWQQRHSSTEPTVAVILCRVGALAVSAG